LKMAEKQHVTNSGSAGTDWLLAVDAGGTQTTAWLIDAAVEEVKGPVGRGRSAGGNPLSVGFDEATRAIRAAVDQARHDASAPSAPIARAILSIAGAASADVRDPLIHWVIGSALAKRVAVVSDFLPVLAAGTPDCCGVALVSGTGSSAFARTADGRTARCGGWGYLLGDEGSGYAIGRAALQHALLALEASREPDALARGVLNALVANSVTDITHAVYGSGDARAKIAGIAPLVITSAIEGQPHAQRILYNAAHELALLANRAAKLVDLAKPVDIAISGGVLVNCAPLRDMLQSECKMIGLDCNLHLVTEPLQGCVRLAAAEFAGKFAEWH
jgi:N-acetylglucosamine kinase-like BadF-type ATPase